MCILHHLNGKTYVWWSSSKIWHYTDFSCYWQHINRWQCFLSEKSNFSKVNVVFLSLFCIKLPGALVNGSRSLAYFLFIFELQLNLPQFMNMLIVFNILRIYVCSLLTCKIFLFVLENKLVSILKRIMLSK